MSDLRIVDSLFNLNREGAKDAKFLTEPGAGPKGMAAFGSPKDALDSFFLTGLTGCFRLPGWQTERFIRFAKQFITGVFRQLRFLSSIKQFSLTYYIY
jgi:hypothetical protein